MKKILSLLLACVMLLGLCACGGSAARTSDASQTGSGADADVPATSDEVFNVSIQFSFPEESGDGVKQVMSAIEEESGGRIKFDVYWSYSFVETGDVINALETNQLDIAGFMPNDFGIFPLNGRMCSLPLLNYPGWEAACKIWLNLLYSTPEMMAEFTDNGMVFWGGYMCPGYQFYSAKEITDTTPSAFNALTVMCDNAEMQSFINANKGGAISVFPPDYLSNLQNGVAEALVQHVNCAFVFGCFDYTKSALFFGEGGFYNLPLAYSISQKFWDKLPQDLRDLFAKYADDICKASYEADYALYSNVAYPALEESANIIMLDDSQIAQWQDACKGIVDDALTDISKDSSTAPDVYAKLKDTIANYDAASFKVGTNNFGQEVEW